MATPQWHNQCMPTDSPNLLDLLRRAEQHPGTSPQLIVALRRAVEEGLSDPEAPVAAFSSAF